MACALGKRRSILLSYEGNAVIVLNFRPEHLFSLLNYWRESRVLAKNRLSFASASFDFAAVPDYGVEHATTMNFSTTGEF